MPETTQYSEEKGGGETDGAEANPQTQRKTTREVKRERTKRKRGRERERKKKHAHTPKTRLTLANELQNAEIDGSPSADDKSVKWKRERGKGGGGVAPSSYATITVKD